MMGHPAVAKKSDKCHMCIGIFIDLDSILGLTCVILQFMPIFL